MANQKPGLYLFEEVEDFTQDLTNEQLGELIRAAFGYRFRGEEYAGSDPLLRMAFRILAGQIQRGAEISKRKQDAARARWEKETQMQPDAEGMQPDAEAMQADAPIQSNPIQSNPIQSNPIQTNPIRSDPVQTGPARAENTPAVQKAYGKYGWVKLTEEQHMLLSEALGRDELERCIEYLDESAQATGNRNKYRDWEVVIRRCSREGWGRRASQGIPKGASGNFGAAEMEAIQQTLGRFDL